MLNFFAISSLCLVWGGTWLAIKIGLIDAPPFYSAAARFLIAVLILLPIIWHQKIKIPPWRRYGKTILITGFCMYGLSYAFVYWSEQFVPSGLTAIIFSTLPFFVALFAHRLLPDEKITRLKIVGMLIGFGGIGFIFWESTVLADTKQFLGMVILLGSPLATAYANVITKRDLHQMNPLMIAVQQMILGTGLLLALGITTERLAEFQFTFRSVGALIYLSGFGSVFAFSTYYWLLKRVEATKLSLIAFVTPLVALLVGWLFGGETLNLRIGLGSLLVLTGIMIATWGSTLIRSLPAKGGVPRKP